jgi:hypothetical protein
MAKNRPKRVNRSLKHKVGNVYKTDYDLGWDYWYTRKPLPLTAPRNMQQGYVSAAKSEDKAQVASMRHAAREGRFVFLRAIDETLIGPDSDRPLGWGHTGRYPVRRARAEQSRVKRVA